MKTFLTILFGGIFVWMVVLTIHTGIGMSLWAAWPSFRANPWAVATLYDAYFGFVTFYVWVFYKERSPGLRFLWFILIMGLGNIAMSFYILIQVFKLEPGETMESILLRRAE